MTKKEIVRVISEELGLTQEQTKKVVQRTLDSIVEMLVREGRIELRNFGVFEVKRRAARSARNPKTSETVHVPEKYVVSFKPGKEMEQRVKDLSEQPGRPEWLDPDYEPHRKPSQSPTADSTEHPARSTHSQNSKSAREADRPIRPTGEWG